MSGMTNWAKWNKLSMINLDLLQQQQCLFTNVRKLSQMVTQLAHCATQKSRYEKKPDSFGW
jgi:hypothetical protein